MNCENNIQSKSDKINLKDHYDEWKQIGESIKHNENIKKNKDKQSNSWDIKPTDDQVTVYLKNKYKDKYDNTTTKDELEALETIQEYNKKPKLSSKYVLYKFLELHKKNL